MSKSRTGKRSRIPAASRRRAATSLVASLLLGLACVSAPQASRPATVELEVVRGAASMPAVGASPVYAIVDARRPEMSSAAEAELLQHATGRAARRFFSSLSADAPLGLVVLGEGLGESCGVPVLVEDPPQTAAPELATRLSRFAAEPPASLAGALELVSDRLAAESAVQPSPAPSAAANAAQPSPARVVVFSTLGSRCAQDLCEPAQRLVEQGAEIDWVVLGAESVPACLAGLRAPLTEGGVHAAALPQAETAVAFRVEPRGGHEGYHRGDRYVPAGVQGRSGGSALDVAPGLVEVQVGLDTPLNLWPVRLSPGRATRIRVLDFPTLGVQRSFVETEPKGRPWFVPRRFQ